MIKTLLFAKLIVLLFFSVSFAQEKNIGLSKKIAFVNELAFEDEKTGIKRFVDAEILASDPGFIGEKDEQKRKEIYERSYKKRAKIVVEPVKNEILALLKQVEIQNNITILKINFDNAGQILAFGEKFDITKQFIAYFNHKSLKPNEVLKLNIPESKLAIINTDSFFDKVNGIKSFTKLKVNSVNASNFCVRTTVCLEIGKFLQSYATSQGFSIIFDSSKKLPEEIGEFKVDDVTQDFIINYNRNNP